MSQRKWTQIKEGNSQLGNTYLCAADLIPAFLLHSLCCMSVPCEPCTSNEMLLYRHFPKHCILFHSFEFCKSWSLLHLIHCSWEAEELEIYSIRKGRIYLLDRRHIRYSNDVSQSLETHYKITTRVSFYNENKASSLNVFSYLTFLNPCAGSVGFWAIPSPRLMLQPCSFQTSWCPTPVWECISVVCVLLETASIILFVAPPRHSFSVPLKQDAWPQLFFLYSPPDNIQESGFIVKYFHLPIPADSWIISCQTLATIVQAMPSAYSQSCRVTQ